MAFDKIVGVDGTTYQFPTLVRTRIVDNIKLVGSAENLAVIEALGPALATKSATTHNHNLADLTNNGLDKLGDVEIGVVGSNGIALDDKHTLQYEGSTATWRNKVASGGVTVGASRPTSAIAGDAWFDSNDGTLYVYYYDGNTYQWVQVQSNSALEGTILARLGSLEGRATVLEATPDYAPNYIMNGAFEINQRNFTSVTTSTAYGHDRWRLIAIDGTVTYSTQAFTPGSCPSDGYESASFARLTTSGQSATNTQGRIYQRIEDVRTLAGKTVTASFWAKSASGTPQVAIGFIQVFGSGGSPSSLVPIASKITLTGGTSWTRYSVTMNIPSISGKTIGTNNDHFLEFDLWTSAGSENASLSASLGVQNTTVDFWGVQLEAGSVATPFHRAATTLQGELAACQRYYWRETASGQYTMFATTVVYQANTGMNIYHAPVTMRIPPTSVEWGGSIRIVTYAGSGYQTGAISSLVISAGNCSNTMFYTTFNTTSGIPTSASSASVVGWLESSNGTGYVGWNAEL